MDQVVALAATTIGLPGAVAAWEEAGYKVPDCARE